MKNYPIRHLYRGNRQHLTEIQITDEDIKHLLEIPCVKATLEKSRKYTRAYTKKYLRKWNKVHEAELKEYRRKYYAERKEYYKKYYKERYQKCKKKLSKN